jgi:hypothetical protein
MFTFQMKDENFFTYLLTPDAKCDMIRVAQTSVAVGMRMQRRRLPLG